MRRLLVTGGSGFVGARLLPLLAERPVEVLALRRRPRPPARPDRGPEPSGGLTWIAGDLTEPGSYAPALAGVDTVVHMAAATGSQPARIHERVNHRGTSDLLECACRAGVSRFLLVSSIAAGFADTSRYPYARSKAAAEGAVRAADLRHLIVRPTLLLGPGSPALAGLERLAGLPVVPVFGSGRTPLQPLDVADLARDLRALVLDEDRFQGETLELGGPEVVTIEELIQAVRRSRGRAAGRVVHLPGRPLAALLWSLERSGLPLPLTAGQIQTFLQDGTAAGRIPAPRRERLTSLADSLARSLSGAAS